MCHPDERKKKSQIYINRANVSCLLLAEPHGAVDSAWPAVTGRDTHSHMPLC